MRLAKIIASTLILLLSLAGIVACFVVKNADDKVKKSGFKTSAVVVDLKVETSEQSEGRAGRGSLVKKETIWGIYEFTIGGTSYRVPATTSGAALGDKTIIYYNPKDPLKDYFLEADSNGFAIGMTVCCIALIAGIVCCYRSYLL